MSGFEGIKRRLLQKNDWAAVGATRPARIPFTPADELARFGKRRKLTHADFDRILPAGGSAAARPVSKHTRQQASSELEPIGHLNIRIRGKQTHAECQNQHHESSQTMLLDEHAHDSENPEGHSTKETDSCLLVSDDDLVSPSVSYKRLTLSSANDKGDSPELHHPVRRLPANLGMSYQSYLPSGNGHPALSGVNSPELHHPVPQFPKRFTIDDRLSAELDSSIAPSPFHTNELLVYGLDETADEHSTSSWLPKPRHQIRRLMEVHREYTPPATSHSGIPYSDYVSPIKLFGQTVTTSPFQYDTVSTLQLHSPEYTSPNQTGSTPTGIVQEGPCSFLRPQWLSGSGFASTHRSRRYATNQYSEINSSEDLDRNFL